MKPIDRNWERAARAGSKARRQGLSAIEAAKAMIEAGFDESAAHIDFKARVAAILASGPADPAIRIRYRMRASMLAGRSLGAGIVAVERWYKAERRAYQIALFARPSPLSLLTLAELRLILRFFRRKGMGDQFPALVEAVLQLPSRQDLLRAAE
jgi:hypothetical protein